MSSTAAIRRSTFLSRTSPRSDTHLACRTKRTSIGLPAKTHGYWASVNTNIGKHAWQRKNGHTAREGHRPRYANSPVARFTSWSRRDGHDRFLAACANTSGRAGVPGGDSCRLGGSPMAVAMCLGNSQGSQNETDHCTHLAHTTVPVATELCDK